MGHTDVVGVQAEKWTEPPFSGLRKDGYIWGRGTLDDKDNVTAGLMLMIMNWDGKSISGVINPGTDNIEISRADLNPDNWTIHIEAGSYVLDGTFERLELPNRSITGSWRNGNARGDFEIVRQ